MKVIVKVYLVVVTEIVGFFGLCFFFSAYR